METATAPGPAGTAQVPWRRFARSVPAHRHRYASGVEGCQPSRHPDWPWQLENKRPKGMNKSNCPVASGHQLNILKIQNLNPISDDSNNKSKHLKKKSRGIERQAGNRQRQMLRDDAWIRIFTIFSSPELAMENDLCFSVKRSINR